MDSSRSRQFETARSISLVGCAPSKRDPKDMDLLYALTKKNDNAKVANLGQVSASILSNSKVVFFDKIFFLLDCFSTKRAEFAYAGDYLNVVYN